MRMKLNGIDITVQTMNELDIGNTLQLNSSEFVQDSLSLQVCDYFNQFSLGASNGIWKAFKKGHYNADLEILNDAGETIWSGLIKNVVNNNDKITTIRAQDKISKTLDFYRETQTGLSPAEAARNILLSKITANELDLNSFNDSIKFQKSYGIKVNINTQTSSVSALNLAQDLAQMSLCYFFYYKTKVYMVQRKLPRPGVGIPFDERFLIGGSAFLESHEDDIVNAFSITHLNGDGTTTNYDDSSIELYNERIGYDQDFSSGDIILNSTQAQVGSFYQLLVQLQRFPKFIYSFDAPLFATDFIKPGDELLIYNSKYGINSKSFQVLTKDRKESSGIITFRTVNMEEL